MNILKIKICKQLLSILHQVLFMNIIRKLYLYCRSIYLYLNNFGLIIAEY